jgi:Xaa-Pro aminopeptidase
VPPVDVIELRRYAPHPGARETLIEIFKREFVEAREAVGLQVLGTFLDVDDPRIARHRNAIDWDRAERMLGLGGIGIEDNVLVTEEGYEVLTADVPVFD